MASKSQPAISPPPPLPPPVHLETIYEESGNSSQSSFIVDAHYQSRNHQKSSAYSANQTIQGLISARSIPSVDAHRRQRTHEQYEKPPIEVRYRNGTKSYIHPSLTTTSMTMSRRKSARSSHEDSLLTTTKMNTKYLQKPDSTSKKKKPLAKQSEIVLTIITAEELSQAGITPPSTSSPDESETVALTESHSNSSLDTITTVKDISLKDTVQVLVERLPTATVLPSIHPVQPVVDILISNLRFPSAPRYHSQHPPQLRHPQQVPNIRSQSLPPSQSHHFPPSNQQKSISNQIPPVAVVPPSPKRSPPSLQITLTSDENEKKLSSKVKHSKKKTSSSKSNNETSKSESKQPFQPSATVLVGGGSRSAFRPFHKSTNLHLQSGILLDNDKKSRVPTHQSTQKSSQQQEIIQSSHPHSQHYQLTSSSKSTHYTRQPPISTTINPVAHNRRSLSSDASKKPLNLVVSNQILSDKMPYSTLKTKSSNYYQESVPISTTNSVDHYFTKSYKSKEPILDSKSPSITVDSNLQWHSVTSKSLLDVPRLSNQYSDIPLRITIPEGTPTYNQKLLHKHDVALEQRLLDAGLSPETIALYERILEVADVRQMDITSPPEIIDQYRRESLL